MSMNMFFVACTQEELDRMDADNHLINEFVDSKGYQFSTDIETAWDVLRSILGGIGIENLGERADGVLFHGCTLVTSETVGYEAVALSKWTREHLLKGLHNIEDLDAYHLEVYQADEDALFRQFEKMVAFYKKASENGLAALSYVA